MNEISVSRRQMLTTFSISSLSGCLSSIPFTSSDKIRLGSMLVERSGGGDENFTDVSKRSNDDDNDIPQDAQTYPIRLFREDRLVFDQTITLAPNEYTMVDPKWSTDPATYTLVYGSEDYVDMLKISSKTQDADEDGCNYLHMHVSPITPSDEPLVLLIDDDHPFADNQEEPKWTC